jgi:FHA domain
MASGGPEVRRLRPTSLVELALTHTMPEFVQRVGGHYVLLFMISDDDAELLAGLANAAAEADQLAFQTDMSPGERSTLAPAARRSRQTQSFEAEDRTGERAVPDLTRMLCFAQPVVKRAHVSFLREVSVGRARNHDIVLRHPSISKFHATFDVAPTGELELKDRESRNGVFVNGARIAGRVRISPGDTLRFGSVQARVGTAEGFHRLARG